MNLIFIIINELVLKEIKELEHTIDYVVNNKDMTKTVSVSNCDEIGKIKTSFNNLMGYINEMISVTKGASHENTSVSEALSLSSQNIVKKVDETTSIVEITDASKHLFSLTSDLKTMLSQYQTSGA